MNPSFNPDDLYVEFRNHLLSKDLANTRETTQAIKSFFRQKYGSNYKVMCSHSESSEYLVDLLVLDFRPKEVIARRTLEILPSSISALIAVESELGGTGASSAYGVMKNVVEDFIKLLLIQCQYRILVFTSLPYIGEVNHIERRVETLQTLYQRASGLTSGVLLIHIEGRRVNSTQVQTMVSEATLSGYFISEDGSSARRILL